MTWSIHHVNLEAEDVAGTALWYRDMLGMQLNGWAFPETRGYLPGDPDKLQLFGDGRQTHTGLHLIKPDPEFATKNDMAHNPSVGGHIAIEVDDLAAVAARLTSAGVAFSLTGEFAIPGMRHLYVEDPEGNLLEINERLAVTAAPSPVQHIVLCALATGSEAAFDALARALDALRSKLLMGPMRWGPDVSPEGLGRGFTAGFVIDFPSEAARDAYLSDADHQALGAQLVALCEGGVEGLLVVDF